ncbi:MAG: acetate/propionate family kinase [Burkholderiaceae bacterium]
MKLLVLNCGSSSIKFALYEPGAADPSRSPSWGGKVGGIGEPSAAIDEDGGAPEPVDLDAARPYHDALGLILRRTHTRLAGGKLIGVVHRVVHGGSKYFEPVRLTQAVLEDLRGYIPLAPLHQPFALNAIELLFELYPDLPQAACFDTAFHHSLPQVEQMFALPWSAWQRGIRRYGFHGLSYDYMSIALPQRHGAPANGRVVVAHLGSGASLCALREGRSVATTMGFSALDGLVMGTRCGTIDPGVLLYLAEIEGLNHEQLGRLLYNESGLLGVSGLSPDTRVLLQNEAREDETGERVRAALALYQRRIVREIGALVAVLGGLDLLVFTAGVGENNPQIRARICGELDWLGVELDEAANAANAPLISTPGSRIRVGVEPTNEEWLAMLRAAPVLPGRP